MIEHHQFNIKAVQGFVNLQELAAVRNYVQTYFSKGGNPTVDETLSGDIQEGQLVVRVAGPKNMQGYQIAHRLTECVGDERFLITYHGSSKLNQENQYTSGGGTLLGLPI